MTHVILILVGDGFSRPLVTGRFALAHFADALKTIDRRPDAIDDTLFKTETRLGALEARRNGGDPLTRAVVGTTRLGNGARWAGTTRKKTPRRNFVPDGWFC
jgi:hypothetical protein